MQSAPVKFIALRAGYQGGINSKGIHEIVYTADIFDKDALDLVVEHDIHVNCGSPDMIDQLGVRKSRAEITLRLNPRIWHGHSQKTNTGGQQSKHGIWHQQIEDCKQRAAQYDIAITGLHMHIGSGTDLEHLAQVCGDGKGGLCGWEDDYDYQLLAAVFRSLQCKAGLRGSGKIFCVVGRVSKKGGSRTWELCQIGD